jgi:hypothetical protein
MNQNIDISRKYLLDGTISAPSKTADIELTLRAFAVGQGPALHLESSGRVGPCPTNHTTNGSASRSESLRSNLSAMAAQIHPPATHPMAFAERNALGIGFAAARLRLRTAGMEMAAPGRIGR